MIAPFLAAVSLVLYVNCYVLVKICKLSHSFGKNIKTKFCYFKNFGVGIESNCCSSLTTFCFAYFFYGFYGSSPFVFLKIYFSIFIYLNVYFITVSNHGFIYAIINNFVN